MILSLSKFFKLDEKKESIHNLREKFAEVHNKIRYRLDTLKPWGYEEFIHEHDCKEKYQKWETEKEHTYNDYYKIIEGKQSLFMEFEKLIDSRLKNIYLIRLNTDLKEKEKIKAKTTKLEDLIRSDMDNSGSGRRDDDNDNDNDNDNYDENKRRQILSMDNLALQIPATPRDGELTDIGIV